MRFPFFLFTLLALMIVTPEPAREGPTKLGGPTKIPALKNL